MTVAPSRAVALPLPDSHPGFADVDGDPLLDGELAVGPDAADREAPAPEERAPGRFSGPGPASASAR